MRLSLTVLMLTALVLPMTPATAQYESDGDRLAEAMESGSVAAVRRVLDSGVKSDTLVYDSPPLLWAIWGEHYYVAKLLIDRGADVNLPDDDGYTPLMAACDVGNKKIITLLLDRKANVNAVELHYGMSALQALCTNGDEALFDLLVERGADVNHIDKYGGNCLEEAAFYGNKAIVEKLKAKGVTTQYPLQVACGLGDLEQVQKLLEAGKQVNKANEGWKNTPLHFAAGSGHLEVVKLLVEHGASLEPGNALGATPLHVAAGSDALPVVKWLLSKGADMNAADTDGSTPLDWSGEKAYEYLQSRGAESGLVGEEHEIEWDVTP